MAEEQNEQNINATNDTTQNVKKDFTGFIGSLKTFLSDLLDIRNNTDQETTLESIKADIPFKGHTSWILICSIFIASVGLNANSTAVVIGAMLISPLMGPILGMGLSLAINDIDTLKRSLKNFGIMVGLSIITAFLFFKFFPLRDASSELLARTQPDIRDVLIAFFGGLALVIARAKKGTIASVIFGVAIATALMPPLCTVGFGLAIWEPEFAMGAMYLFIINTIFIGLATFLVIKILRFPMVKYANSARRKRTMHLASVVAIIVMCPAIYTFYNVFQKAQFNNQAERFIADKIQTYKFSSNGRFLKNLSEIDYDDNKKPSIELVFMGDEIIPDNVINTWRAQKDTYKRLQNAELLVVQGGKNDDAIQLNYVTELYENNKALLKNKDEELEFLQKEVIRLKRIVGKQVPFSELTEELKINYPEIEKVSFANRISTNFDSIDTIPTFSLKWKSSTTANAEKEMLAKIDKWLKTRLKQKELVIEVEP